MVAWVATFKAATTTAARTAGFARQLWQRRFYDRCLSRHGESVEAATIYVTENPVRAGLVDRAEDWPYTRVAWEPTAAAGKR